MIINPPGIVTDRILLLGKEESNVYLVGSKNEYILVGGGSIHIIPEVLSQIEHYKIEPKAIKRILFLHAHFDHCGTVPYFKKQWPWAVVTASQRAKTILSRPGVLETIDMMNQGVLAYNQMQKETEDMGLTPFNLEVEETVSEGDFLSCGDLTLQVLEVPGHSSCSIAVYVPEKKAMFASDAGGIPFGDMILTAANSNFDLYQQSLDKMAGYEVDVFLAEHYGARTGEAAQTFLTRSIEVAKTFRGQLEESLKHSQSIEKSTEEITRKILAQAPDYFLPYDILKIVVGQMLKYLDRQVQ
ncbi:MAG: MBL fold metallo-hydrolase [Desulfobacteraceae bacterium]|nr:MBL fold metallo-hydrolase [Desulfobacteraceae bacterium]